MESSVLCTLSIQVGGAQWVVGNMYSTWGKGGSGDTDVIFISIQIIDKEAPVFKNHPI